MNSLVTEYTIDACQPYFAPGPGIESRYGERTACIARVIRQAFSVVTFGLCMLVIPAKAANVVIDFDGATPGGVLTADYVEDSFTMTLVSDHYDIWGSGGTGGSQYLGLDALNASAASVRFTSGGLFDLLSFESIQWSPGVGEFLTVTSSAGGSVSFDTSATHLFSGTLWSGLSWIDFSSNASIGGPGLDTLSVSTVPLPATIWLFGSGLVGLIGLSRRKKT